jgi:hypothetical protein
MQQYYDQLLEQQKNFTPEQLQQYQAFYQHFTQQLQNSMAAASAPGSPMAMPIATQPVAQPMYQPQMQTFAVAQPAAAPQPDIDMTSTVNSYLAQSIEPDEPPAPQPVFEQSSAPTPLPAFQQTAPVHQTPPASPLTSSAAISRSGSGSGSGSGNWGMSTIAPGGGGTPPQQEPSPLAQSLSNLGRSGSFGNVMMSTIGPVPSGSSSTSSTPSTPILNRSQSSAALGAEGDVSTPVGSPIAFSGPKTAPTPGSRDVVRDDLVFFSKNFQIVIKGGTIGKLVERLTFESTTDSDYVETFLLTYRSMIPPSELLECLFQRYEHGMTDAEEEQSMSHLEAETMEKKQKIIRLRVGNVLKRWVSEHFHDFSKDPSLLERLNSNLARIQEKGLVDQLKKQIADSQAQSAKKKEFTFSTPPPPSIAPKSPQFEDFDPLEIARQLCLIEQEIFAAIHPKECLNQSWNKRKEQAQNIIKMIHFFNNFSRWVATKLVSEPELKARSKLLKKFVQILVFSRQYNNFDAMQAILAGLNNASIFRLKLTWSKVEKEKFFNQFVEARDIMDSTGSFSNYRKAVQAADPPIIPYLGVYLTDLTFIEDGNPDMLPVQDGRTDIVNFEKMRKVAAVIKDISTYQQTPYNLSKVDVIYNYFVQGKLETLEDGALFKKSREIESPQVQEAKLKKRESGLLRKFSFSSKSKSGTPEK